MNPLQDGCHWSPDGPVSGGGSFSPPPQPPQPTPQPVFRPAAQPSPAAPPTPLPAHHEDAKPKIQAFGQALGGGKKSENWKRKPNVTGTGASHVKTFHSKLNAEAVAFMDEQINQWLDEHPEYEVKFVTTSVGEWQGKLKEIAMVVSVWV